MTGKITLRFVAGSDPVSSLIRLQAGLSMPITPSHVECVSQDGKWYIGQHAKGGMLRRPPGYDAAWLMAEKLVELPCSDEQEAAFYAYIESKIGQPYDWKSILDFIDPALNLHEVDHLICSAIQTAGMRHTPEKHSAGFLPYFPWPMTKPFHRISPDFLFGVLSTHVEISH